MSTSIWTWDETYRKYWRYKTGANGIALQNAEGNYERIWQDESESQNGTQPIITDYAYQQNTVSSSSLRNNVAERRDSKTSREAEMAPAASNEVRHKIAVAGTPNEGWYEGLDQSYRVRTSDEEYKFFKQGRVFAVLWSETASETIRRHGNEDRDGTENSKATAHPRTQFSRGQFGQTIYSSIRRFVVTRVSLKQHYVEACAITTYGKRGTLKPGCNPAEHTIVYLKTPGARPPKPLKGEKGMTMEPIAIVPTEPGEYMEPTSRLRLGKVFPVECNVKVRDIGMIALEDRTRFMRYHKTARSGEFEADEYDYEEPLPTQAHSSVAQAQYSAHQATNQQAYYAQEHGSTSAYIQAPAYPAAQTYPTGQTYVGNPGYQSAYQSGYTYTLPATNSNPSGYTGPVQYSTVAGYPTATSYAGSHSHNGQQQQHFHSDYQNYQSQNHSQQG